MDSNEKSLDLDKCLTKTQFQKELDKWFQSQGILGDLRSYLRHLMVMALQNTQIGPKPTDEASPKIQAVNLLIAEHLLKHNCHYTLSVFTSEVPALNGFCNASIRAPLINKFMTNFNRKSNHKNYCKENGDIFLEKELDDILSALGLPLCAYEVKRVRNNYLQNSNKNSLLELLLQLALEVSAKLDGQLNFENSHHSKSLLSNTWASSITNILLNENIRPPQISFIQKSIMSITEKELEKKFEEIHKKQVELLMNREKRIQEYLRKYENDIFFKLKEAEKNLNERKDCIQEELIVRQKHLSKIAFEWKNKHDEIIKFSKNLLIAQNENKKLKAIVETLEKKNRYLKIEKKKQEKTISNFREEISLLTRKMKKITEANITLNELLNKSIKKEKVNLNTKFNSMQIAEVSQTSDYEKNCLDATEALTKKDESNEKNISDMNFTFDMYQENFSSLESSPDNFILIAKKKFQDLEEEFRQVNKNYFDYKTKYTVTELSESESSICISNESFAEISNNFTGDINTKRDENIILKMSECSQTQHEQCQEDRETTLIKINKEEKNFSFSENESSLKNSVEKLVSVKFAKTPTKRQLRNRKCFLESRELLRAYEKQKEQRPLSITDSDSSDQTSFPASLEKIHSPAEIKETSEDFKLPAVNALSVTFENDIPPEMKIIEAQNESVQELMIPDVSLVKDLKTSLLQEMPSRMLRQQISLNISDEEDNEILKNISDKEDEGKKISVLLSSRSSISSGNVSVPKNSVNETFF